MIEVYSGDAWELEYTILDSNNNLLDLSGYEIRAELYNSTSAIRKANTLVEGGSSEEINIVGLGKVLIVFNSVETKSLSKEIFKFEIEITKNNKPLTVVTDEIKVIEAKISWKNKGD